MVFCVTCITEHRQSIPRSVTIKQLWLAQVPPYHTPIYLENVALAEVAEVTGSLLDTDYLNPADSDQQQWNLDPWQIQQDQFFLKLNKDTSCVVQTPEEESAQAFMKIQGDVYHNHGIQVWVLEPLAGSNMWALKNLNTQWYLCTDYSQPGQTKVPIIVRPASPEDDPHAQWKITEV